MKWWRCWGSNMTDKFQPAFLWSSAILSYINPKALHIKLKLIQGAALYFEAFVIVSHSPFQLLIMYTFTTCSSCTYIWRKGPAKVLKGVFGRSLKQKQKGRKNTFVLTVLSMRIAHLVLKNSLFSVSRKKLCMCFIIMKGNVEVPELNEILENKYTFWVVCVVALFNEFNFWCINKYSFRYHLNNVQIKRGIG